jgi:endonuclease YncB( thermonuclease family)
MGIRRRQTPEHRAALRRRRLIRSFIASLLTLFVSAAILDHLGCFGYRGDDHANFDGKSFTIDRVTDRGSLVLRDRPGTEVVLLGVALPRIGERFGDETKSYLTRAVGGKPIILKLDPLETRDANGLLRAYVYLTDNDVLNVDFVRDGFAYADARQKYTLRASIQAAETDARKHSRGVWKN